MGRAAKVFLRAGPGANTSYYTAGSVQVLGSGSAAQSAVRWKSLSPIGHVPPTGGDPGPSNGGGVREQY